MKMEPIIPPYFPPVLQVAWRDPRRAYPLVGAEAELVARAVPRRRAEFSAGRSAARAALAMPDQEIHRAETRAPIWPEGWCGSISHSAERCVAVAARTCDLAGVGVDLEPDVPLDAALRDTILRPEEGQATAAQAIRVFSMKEAVYKALSAFLPRPLSFHDMALSGEDGAYIAQLCCDAGPFKTGDCFAVTCQTYEGHVLGLCCLEHASVPC